MSHEDTPSNIHHLNLPYISGPPQRGVFPQAYELLFADGRYGIRVTPSILAFFDFFVIVACGVAGKIVYVDSYPGSQLGLSSYAGIIVLLAATTYLTMKRMGLYAPDVITNKAPFYGNLLGGLSQSFLMLLGLLYVMKASDWVSRGWILLWFIASAVGLLVMRLLVGELIRRQMLEGPPRREMAVYGSPEVAAQVRQKLESGGSDVRIVGMFHDGVHDGGNSFNGGLDELKDTLSRRACDGVIIGLPPERIGSVPEVLRQLAGYSTELVLCTDLQDYPVPVIGTRMIGNVRTDVVARNPHVEYSRFVKYAMDKVGAIFALVMLSPLLVIIGLAIKIDSRGPVFFQQRRFGENNKVFKIFKFRTMSVAEDGEVVTQASRKDDRVTRVGRILRRSSLDELPQLFNVLMGQMSMVGPRPHAMAHEKAFDEALNRFSRRRSVRPGITGWAQVNGCRGEIQSPDDLHRRMEYDLFYVTNWSIWFDVEILLRTIVTISRNAY